MAATIQTRITEDAKERLERLAQETGKTQQEVIDTALRQYERDLFLDSVNDGYAALKADPEAWAAELAERERWDVVIADGLSG